VAESSYRLHEDELRDLVAERFAGEKVYFSEDFAYAKDGVEFEVDGFNEKLGIGYDYMSLEDIVSLAICDDGPGCATEFLDDGERILLVERMEAGGDAILVIESGSTMSAMGERTVVRSSLEEFILDLKAAGRL
jgi:hypothetical protein